MTTYTLIVIQTSIVFSSQLKLRNTYLQFLLDPWNSKKPISSHLIMCKYNSATRWIRIQSDRFSFINVFKYNKFFICGALYAVRACYVNVFGRWDDSFSPPQLPLNKIPRAGQAHIILAVDTVEHLVKVSETYWTQVLELFSFLNVCGSLISML